MDVAAAVSDPVRREILGMLRGRSLTAGQIACRFEISRPAVSRHLRVLRESGLVTDQARGRQRVYELDVRPLADLDSWLSDFRQLWSSRLDALETEVYRTRRERRQAGRTTPAEESA